MTKIIYQGEWDGQRIWRKQSVSEQLLEEIEKNKHEKYLQSNR